MQDIRVALVHDHLQSFGGAERVLFALHRLFPHAPIYTLYGNEKVIQDRFGDADVRFSFLQKFPQRLRSRFRALSLLAISAVEGMDLSEYNVVISSSAFFAKGVITNPTAIHIAYCHTPPRVLWGIDRAPSSFFASPFLHMMRMWDVHSALRPTVFLANSHTVRARIAKYYRQNATVVYPPIDITTSHPYSSFSHKRQEFFDKRLPKQFFLVVSRLTEHKRVDIAVDGFAKMNHPLVVIGTGPEYDTLKKRAGDKTILLGYQPDGVVYECMKRCKALIHTSEEDFGMTPVEAMMHGKPVLAYRRGGASESITEGKNGEFFDAQHHIVLADGVRRINEKIEQGAYDSDTIKDSARIFEKDNFAHAIKRVVRNELATLHHQHSLFSHSSLNHTER